MGFRIEQIEKSFLKEGREGDSWKKDFWSQQKKKFPFRNAFQERGKYRRSIPIGTKKRGK